MKKWWIAVIGAGAVCIGLIAIAVAYYSQPATVHLGDGMFEMRIARTETELQQGLSGTQQLPDSEALVFDFPREYKWGIWMKDMNYPIDIVWLDASKKVVHIVENAKPESYPDTTYRPDTPAKYVIELKAGAVDSKRITIGAQAAFDSSKGSFE